MIGIKNNLKRLFAIIRLYQLTKVLMSSNPKEHKIEFQVILNYPIFAIQQNGGRSSVG